MLIESVRVRNYRSILDETLSCHELTALVGKNGCGKSTFLKAIDLFYKKSPKIEVEDFYNSDQNFEITVCITFKDLSEEATALLSPYIQDNKLVIERVLKLENGKALSAHHGSSLQNPDFQKIRQSLEIKDRGKSAKDVYNSIRTRPDYADLPEWTSITDAKQALDKWELEHKEKCTRHRDDGKFFSFTEVGQVNLGRFTRFLFIPAVRDASDDAAEGRDSVLTDLMDMVVRNQLARQDSLNKLREETQKRYEEKVLPEIQSELKGLAGNLSKTLQTYIPNTTVDLRWLPIDQIKIDMPKAEIKLVEDGFPTSVHRTGHGLQRAFILTMLQHLAMVQSVNDNNLKETIQSEQNSLEDSQKNSLPNLVLAVEEPELYQHPNRQRHLAKIFLQLANNSTPGVAEKTQIIYATHSPLFVGLDRFDQIRVLRKRDVDHQGMPKITKVIKTTLDKVAEELWKAEGGKGDKYTGDTLKNRLHSIMTPRINEGFFADAVALVEGDDDYAAIIGMANVMGKDLESMGISIIPVNGKRSLDRPALIFREFGIPVFILWDSDGGKGETAGVCCTCGKSLDSKPDPLDNHRLLRIVGTKEEDWPEHQQTHFCCFKSDLETTMQCEIGHELFDELLSDCQKTFGIPKRKHAIKNPQVLSRIIELAKEQGKTSKTLEAVVLNIVKLSTEKTL